MFFSFGFLFECNNTMDNEMFLLLYLIPFSCFTHLSFLFHEATDILRFNAVFFTIVSNTVFALLIHW